MCVAVDSWWQESRRDSSDDVQQRFLCGPRPSCGRGAAPSTPAEAAGIRPYDESGVELKTDSPFHLTA